MENIRTFCLKAVALVLLVIVALEGVVLATQCVRSRPNDFRSITGECNNLNNADWGKTDSLFRHPEGLNFVDGISERRLMPNERNVSNLLLAERPYDKISYYFDFNERRFGLSPDPKGRNMLFVIFGQFLTHDFTRNRVIFNFQDILKNFQVEILDTNDPLYEEQPVDLSFLSDPRVQMGYPRKYILTLQSVGTMENGIFEGVNQQTAYLDGSAVYGATEEIANKLRTFQGGKLNVTAGNNLPLAGDLLVPNQCGQFGGVFSAAGDDRVDENPLLTTFHLLFVREHNRLCDDFASRNPSWNDERIFQEARKWVIAYLQHLAFDEYFPILLGRESWERAMGSIDRYSGSYNASVDASLGNTFGVAAIRLGHAQVNFPMLMAKNPSCDFDPLPGTLPGFPLQERSACTKHVLDEVGVEAFIRGSIIQQAQEMNGKFSDDLRNIFSKVDTPFGNFDVETNNIHRGRVHGVPGFRDVKLHFTGVDLYQQVGCYDAQEEDPLECFLHITRNVSRATLMKSLYKKVLHVDAFVGFNMEDRKTETGYSYTAAQVLFDQLRRMRQGDRFWYENIGRDRIFNAAEIRSIKSTTMADIIKRNTNLQDLPADVFYTYRYENGKIKDNVDIVCPQKY